MPENKTPYDTGLRLEPKIWVQDPATPAPAQNTSSPSMSIKEVEEKISELTGKAEWAQENAFRLEDGDIPGDSQREYAARLYAEIEALTQEYGLPSRLGTGDPEEGEYPDDDTTYSETATTQMNGDNYGRVDFDDPESNTIFTAWIQKNEDGSYIMRVDEHQDVKLTIETSSQRHEREAAMQYLSAEMAVIATDFGAAIEYSDQDPDAFGVGHFVFHNADGNQRLVMTEQYIGTDSLDADRIPNSWSWRAEKYATVDGAAFWVQTGGGEVNASGINQLVNEIDGWAQARYQEHSSALAAANQAHQQQHDQMMQNVHQQRDQPGITH
ncbi:hypothetical protein ACFWHR_12255 [Leucobacter sp. NPDC058333]|uniref:hypothetical protein n=1 Tax=Leucobacter sp. NPDC058333 TaxID=3346450 RepID=UPI003659DB6F